MKQGQHIYRVDDIEIDPSSVCLKRAGKEVHLRQKTFQVLNYLVEHRDRLVTKEELISAIWPDTAVTDNTLDQSLAEIRRALGDDSRSPRFIKTVPRAGYRFIGLVEEIQTSDKTAVLSDEPHEVESKPVARARSSFKRPWVIGGAVIIALGLVVGTVVFVRQRNASTRLTGTTLPQDPSRQSVAVMFFENRSGNEDLDWLREGLADMVITGLSRSKKVTVLSRQQLSVLLERSGQRNIDRIELEKALEVARHSQAKFVVLGSFARLGQEIRIDVHLHNGADGQLLTAERLIVNDPAQILNQVDLLSLKLATYLGASNAEPKVELSNVMTKSLEAYRYYSLGVEKEQAVQNPEAIALLEKAIALDPEFAMAYARIGYTYVMGWGRSEEGKPYLEKAFKLTDRLSEKDRLNIAAWYAVANQDYSAAIKAYQEIVARYPLEVEGYRRLGGLLRGDNRLNEALEVLKQGLVIDSEAKDLYNGLGGTYSDLGRHDEAIAMFQRYVSLAPDEPNAHDSLGLGYQWAGRYEDAIREYERAISLKPDFYISVIHLANTFYQTGRYRLALQQFQRYLEIVPSIVERGRGYSGIAQIERARGRVDEAERAARLVLASAKTGFGSMLMVALEKGDLTAAQNLEEKLKQVQTKGRGARGDLRELPYYQGLLELKRGHANEAIEKFKEVLRHRPPTWNIEAYEDCLAKAYLDLGRLDEALSEFDRILKLNPNYPLVHYHMAQIYERKKQMDQVRTQYEHFLRVWKDADSEIPEVLVAKKALSVND
jgi:tetratricopeptide (TPR) repeat protein/DNA-binding winged helix-turn-helix (wHTH) protein